jgi:hypothetical protein
MKTPSSDFWMTMEALSFPEWPVKKPRTGPTKFKSFSFPTKLLSMPTAPIHADKHSLVNANALSHEQKYSRPSF